MLYKHGRCVLALSNSYVLTPGSLKTLKLLSHSRGHWFDPSITHHRINDLAGKSKNAGKRYGSGTARAETRVAYEPCITAALAPRVMVSCVTYL
jgi:hypothetical protein